MNIQRTNENHLHTFLRFWTMVSHWSFNSHWNFAIHAHAIKHRMQTQRNERSHARVPFVSNVAFHWDFKLFHSSTLRHSSILTFVCRLIKTDANTNAQKRKRSAYLSYPITFPHSLRSVSSVPWIFALKLLSSFLSKLAQSNFLKDHIQIPTNKPHTFKYFNWMLLFRFHQFTIQLEFTSQDIEDRIGTHTRIWTSA